MGQGVSWSFFGFVTAAGGEPVQDWYDGLSNDERDEVQDTLVYLSKLPVHLWKKPQFDHLGDGVGEFRFKANNRVFRIYCFFWPRDRRYSCTLLLGAHKTVNNPKQDISDARKR